MTHNASPDDDEPSPSSDDAADKTSRRWLIRVLVGLGLGIPIAIEASTFFGLLSGERGDGSADIGDELLTETPQTETLVDSSVFQGPPRQYEFIVEVTNNEETPYELTAGPLYTDAGEKSETTTAEIAAGEGGELVSQWEIPADATPTAVQLRATWGENELSERVALARPAVYQGSP